MKKLFGLLLLQLAIGNWQLAMGQDGYTVLCDSNGVALSGFYFPASNITGTVTSQLPSNVVYTASLLSVSNTVATNAAAQLQSVSNVLATAQTSGTNWVFTNLLSKLNTTSNYLATNWTASLNTASNLLATNWIGQLNSVSNLLATNLTGSITNSSNGLSSLFSYNLYVVSNLLAGGINSNTLAITASSNSLRSTITTTSNTLNTAVLNVSNFVAGVSNLYSSYGASKAFTATLPATYSSIGIGFSTPLMPDGNYSVSLFPQDANTADAILLMQPYVSSKNNSGFTIYVLYATNAFNLNFECQVKENTQ